MIRIREHRFDFLRGAPTRLVLLARLSLSLLLLLFVAACPSPAVNSPAGNFDPLEALDRKSDAFGKTVPPSKPAVKRKGAYAGFVEEFNRYYTEPGYVPLKTIYVSPGGGGDGS